MKTTLVNSVSGHTAQTCSVHIPNAQNVYDASSNPGSGIEPDNLAKVNLGASVSNILTAEDCKTCPARGKCEELKAGTRLNIELGNDNCLVLRGNAP